MGSVILDAEPLVSVNSLALIETGGGKGPLKPGQPTNQPSLAVRNGANSCGNLPTDEAL
jgi:hypothetical protein